MTLDQTEPGAIPARPPIHSDAPHADPQVALADAHLRQLAEMREVGMWHLRDTQAEDQRDGHDPRFKIARKKAFDIVSRSIRQIMALEQEIIGLRAKRVHFLRDEGMRQRAKAVRASVERSVEKAQPQLDRFGRERLLADLFVDYRKFADGNLRDIIEGICKTLGITADLSLWDEPQPGADIQQPEDFKQVLPVDGEETCTEMASPSGIRVQAPYDSDHIERHANGPPKPG